MADSTISNYANGIKQFHAFCNRENVPLEYRLPASEFLLCAFAASHAGILAGSTAQNCISAIRAWHIANDAHWSGDVCLNYVLNGVENLTPNSARKPLRPPIMRAMIKLLDAKLSHRNTLDVCVLMAAKTAFWGQCRLTEILLATATKLPSHAKPQVSLHAHLQDPCTSAGSRILHLPQTKRNRNKGEDIMLCRQEGASDVIAALVEHLAVNIFPSNYPLFSYHTACGLHYLTRAKLLDRCNEIWALNGLPGSSGHSFHIGGTTELLISGVPPDVVKTMGRWSSNSFLRYWRLT
jgi:hypothetical protein